MFQEHLTDKLTLPPPLKALYIYVKNLSSGNIRLLEEGPPSPFDHIDIPDGILGDFMEAVDEMLTSRQPWKKLPGSTNELILWKLPNGKVFLERFDTQGNLLSFTLVDEPSAT